MSGIRDAISDRAKGQYSLSIPTSLAVEYIAGIHEERPEKIPPAKKYKAVAINLETLCRNFINSIDRVSRVYLTADVSEAYLYSEIEALKNTLADLNLELNIFKVDYRGLEKKFPEALIKRPTTNTQINDSILMEDFCKSVMGMDFNINKISDPEKIRLNQDCLIMTHLPVDLLSSNRASGAHLLESHTGRIKKREDWGSKLGLGNDVSVMPFNRLSIQVFGDKANHFLSMPKRMKQPLLELAHKNGWNKKTTESRIRASLDRIPDKEIIPILKKML